MNRIPDSSSLKPDPMEGRPVQDELLRPTGGRQGSFVRVMTVAIVALVMAMLSLIYWRDLVTREPSCAVALFGDQTLDGAKVEVAGDNGHWEATLSADNGFQTPVLLEPGQYSVQVTHHNRVVLNSRFVVDRYRMVPYVLRSAVPVIVPPNPAPTSVAIEGITFAPRREISLEPLVLNDANHYRSVVYLAPGDYTATASRNGKVIAVQTLHLEHGKPVDINFTRPQSTTD